MSLTERLDSFQRRHRWAGFPIAVTYKFFDDQGSYLSALIAYYSLVSLLRLSRISWNLRWRSPA